MSLANIIPLPDNPTNRELIQSIQEIQNLLNQWSAVIDELNESVEAIHQQIEEP